MKILVVEDEPRIARNIQQGLELKSYVVDVAYDGNVGWAMANDETYDVIVLDRMLPGIDGLEICRRLRQDNIFTPILLLTALDQIEDRVEGLECGADDYLGKPFAFSELLARIKALSRRPKHQEQSILSVDSLSLDTRTYQVKRNNRFINLSKKEFAVLEYLLRHRGEVISPEQLTEHVWSFESDVLANTAQVYIGYVRTKIDRAFPDERPLIHTIRGFGYKLE